MRTQVYLRFAALALLGSALFVASAQSGNSGQGGTQQGGQGTGQNQSKGQGQGQGDPTKPHPDDPIAKLRDAARAKNTMPSAVTGYQIDTIGPISAKVHEFITFKAIARNKKQERMDLVYSLKDAPSDARMDPLSGVFGWYPQTPGTFNFSVIGGDPDNPDATVEQKVTIIVSKPLANWGYDFFAAPRAAILSRMLVIQQGLTRAGIPFAASPSNAMSSSLIPDNSALSQVLNGGSNLFTMPQNQGGLGGAWGNNQSQGTGMGWGQNSQNNQNQGGKIGQGGNNNGSGNGNGSGNSQNQNGGDANQNNGSQSGSNQGGNGQSGNGQNGSQSNNQGSLGNQGPGNLGGQAQGIPQLGGFGQVQGNSAGGATTSFGQPQINPYARLQSGQDPSFLQTVDALRYFVGPFDMMGGNVFIPAPERYQLGPGDILIIRVSSPTLDPKEDAFKVDERGLVGVPMTGRKINVRGQTLAKAEELIKSEVRRDIRNAEVNVSLKELRTMSLTVLGEAFMPGSYQVPAVATLFNAIYLVGGPTDSGSLRRIELRRNDGTKRSFDLYRFLVYGDAKQDVPLQPGDTIFIPPVESRVTVQGEVGRPAIYETVEGEHLQDVISFAGKAKPTGVTQRVSLSTVEPGVGLKLMDVDLTKKDGTNNPQVYAGDSVEVFSVRPEITNVITLDGAVDQPGQYAMSDGMTVASLIARARGLLPEAYRDRADVFRQNEDKSVTLIPVNLQKALTGDPTQNIGLKSFDRIVIYRTSDVQWMGTRQVTVRGAIRKPASYYRADNMRVIDLLIQAGGLNGDAFMEQGYLQRFNDDGTTAELVKIDFRRVATGDQSMNVVLRDRDLLTIQSVNEAKFVPDQQVQILGAVQNPGVYLRSNNMTLKDLLQMAGGFLPNVSDTLEVASARVPDGTKARQFKIADVMSGADVPLEAGDLVTVPARSNFQDRPRTVMILGAVEKPGAYAINSTTDKISDIVARAGGPTRTAFLKGAQFVRDPAKLRTLSQSTLSPKILDVLQIVADEEYKRALAKAEVEKLRISKSVQSNSTADTSAVASSLGLGAASTTPPVTKETPLKFNNNTVSPARPLTEDELNPLGNINVRLDEALKRPMSNDNLVMEEGDIVFVPETPSTVTVAGAVTVQSAILHVPGKTVAYYVERSGGLVIDAAKDRVLIIRAGGEVIRANARTKVELGDYILVPTKVMAERLTDKQAEIDTISKNVTSFGLLFAILKSILK